jgi:hypothetical protein
MLTVESYPVAVAMCVVTMLCWGSWANTQKLHCKLPMMASRGQLLTQRNVRPLAERP